MFYCFFTQEAVIVTPSDDFLVEWYQEQVSWVSLFQILFMCISPFCLNRSLAAHDSMTYLLQTWDRLHIFNIILCTTHTLCHYVLRSNNKTAKCIHSLNSPFWTRDLLSFVRKQLWNNFDVLSHSRLTSNHCLDKARETSFIFSRLTGVKTSFLISGLATQPHWVMTSLPTHDLQMSNKLFAICSIRFNVILARFQTICT